MSLLALSQLPFSAQRGWPELASMRPSLARMFLFVVLPLSLVPPLMLYYAGTHHPQMFPADYTRKPWVDVAAVFFVAEIATVLLMGWLIRQVARTNQLQIDQHDSFMLAAIAPVPMWLSALGLLVPNFLFAVIVAIVGLVLACSIVHHGILALCRTREEVLAEGIVQTVIGAGLVAWVLLMVLALA
jgi:hypothetical protein